MKNDCIIIDIDGTLANIEHRREVLLEDNDWKKFNSKIKLDSINLWCLEIINSFKSKYSIILVTGRTEEFSELTLEWLSTNDVHFTDIYFRKNGDFRDDTIIKEEVYKQHIEPRFNPLFVVDDRNKVVKMWRDLGLVCLQCDYGDF